MSQILDALRAEYAQEEAGRKWWQRSPKGDGMLYLGARMQDAENAQINAEQLAHATERAAVHIIKRYGAEAVDAFYQELKLIKRHLDE